MKEANLRRPWLTVIALLICGAALAAICMIMANRHKPEPMFSGRTITQWLAGRDFETNRAAVIVAVLALGEISVPALRRMLHSGTKSERMWFAKAPRWLYRRLPVGGYQFDFYCGECAGRVSVTFRSPRRRIAERFTLAAWPLGLFCVTTLLFAPSNN
jgi:hypothetical protein